MVCILLILGVCCTLSIHSTSNLNHIETVNYKLVNYSVQAGFVETYFYTTGVYDPLYSTVHPMKYLESEYKSSQECIRMGG